MATFVHSRKAEIAVLARFAVFGAVYHERSVARRTKLRRVGEIDGKGDCLTTEPVADVAGVPC